MKRFNTKNNFTRQYQKIKQSKNQTSHLIKRGQFGLRSLDYKQVDIKQINSIKKLIQKEIKLLEKKTNVGKIKIWFYMFPNKAVTKFSPETRMGKGKGAIISQCCYVRPGQLLFEFSSLPKLKVAELISCIKNLLSFKTQSLSKF
uniref:Ribosomal protein L16 n=1 Tax=Pyropia perforata TaxID=182771 RepID=A0A059SUJ3_PYRPE|nr:50S ribosomal protein L16 [Neoporphyra perforata]AHB35410.1 50S ribosomal protein L16 [Neoporphyra perforata]AHB35437.1 50S ribosomal protein L16 [Neoporphyra perforata]AIB08098.1 ribosomal protein L16 [Neoporphyra perforata]AIB08187.1 ribosomal protein L16 [Neoporphyra perforata]